MLNPVVMPVPAADSCITGIEKTQIRSIAARKALKISANLQGLLLGAVEKEKNGAPRPNNGIYWSLSHSDEYVAAVTAPEPIGIDIEKTVPCPRSLPLQIADREEWALAPSLSTHIFYCYWTAKEAVLKAVNIGLSGLSDCKIVEAASPGLMKVRYKSEIWMVTNYSEIPQHVVSVTNVSLPLKWHIAP